MKKYRLRQWYPSLPKDWKDKRGIVSFNADRNGYKMEGVDNKAWILGEHELSNKDFWELIEEENPLFITEDGVTIYTNNIKLFAVNDMFETASSTRFDFDVSRKEGWKLFYLESNADEYIWRNKRVFSYKDIQNYGVHPVNMIRVEQLAKERIEQ